MAMEVITEPVYFEQSDIQREIQELALRLQAITVRGDDSMLIRKNRCFPVVLNDDGINYCAWLYGANLKGTRPHEDVADQLVFLAVEAEHIDNPQPAQIFGFGAQRNSRGRWHAHHHVLSITSDHERGDDDTADIETLISPVLLGAIIFEDVTPPGG